MYEETEKKILCSLWAGLFGIMLIFASIISVRAISIRESAFIIGLIFSLLGFIIYKKKE